MERAAAFPDQGGDSRPVLRLRQLGNGRVDPVAGRRDVEAAQRRPDQGAGRERHDAGGGVQLAQHGEPGAALGGVLVGTGARDGEDGGVLDLVGERLGPGTGVLAGGVLSVLDELVRHGQFADQPHRVHRRDDTGEFDRLVQAAVADLAAGDQLDRRVRIAAAPQLDDGQAVLTGVGDAQQFRQQVLAQRAAGAVVAERRLGVLEDALLVAQLAMDDAE